MSTAADLAQEQGLDYSPWKKRTNFALFCLMHALPILTIWMDVSVWDFVMCFGLYVVRMFGVTAGYHRYFSHKTYKMGRVMQFLMALLAMSGAQKGVLWWASHHRHHHKHSDDEHDVHSPRQKGFWYSHVGWILDPKWEVTREESVRDLSRFPELVWLNKHPILPTFILGFLCWAVRGWEGLLIGHFLSTVLLWHGTFTINSLTHVIGKRRYETTDDSRNHWLLAIITLGEGWHNNHHYYPSSTRQGFRWWEFDPTYYTLKVLSWLGLVWDLREPPAHVIDGTREARLAAFKEKSAKRQEADANGEEPTPHDTEPTPA
jgi:stearoyl-CoA desaturase (delta-9 desaturase)